MRFSIFNRQYVIGRDGNLSFIFQGFFGIGRPMSNRTSCLGHCFHPFFENGPLQSRETSNPRSDISSKETSDLKSDIVVIGLDVSDVISMARSIFPDLVCPRSISFRVVFRPSVCRRLRKKTLCLVPKCCFPTFKSRLCGVSICGLICTIS